ncbi:MAG: hypothetical protein HZB42_03540 [Sphingobacteriales bacterium]|nr:hypothetical protein [Sphingobacteriales bacterium]
MKQLFIVAGIIVLLAFTGSHNQSEKNNAEVNQVQGLYIFSDSKPKHHYEYLGTVIANETQVGKTALGQPVYTCFCDLTYSQLRDNLIKLAKKKFKEGNGIIIDAGSNKGDVIKLNE